MNANRIKLLIAEDNEADVYLIREALDNSGFRYDAVVAGTGEKAIAAVDEAIQAPERRFHAVILDLNLTTHSGLEILKLIRDSPVLANTRVIVFTSSESPAEQQRASLFCPDLYLRKPMDLDGFMDIGRRIASLLSS